MTFCTEHLAEGIDMIGGDCLAVLPTLAENSIDSCVTDPPYGLEFMGKEWDKFAPRERKNASVWDGRRQAQSGWREDASARSGKGGGGPSYRSQHKGSKRCALCGKRAFSGSPCECPEPQWVIEHRQEAPTAMLGFQAFMTEWAHEVYRVIKPGAHLLAFGGTRTYHRLACAIEDAGFEIRDSIQWLYGQGFPKSRDVSKDIDKAAGAEREVVGPSQFSNRGRRTDNAVYGQATPSDCETITAPATDAARQWLGFGTALKPACEPIVLARKPLSESTVAANVLIWGTGALNIDGCRVAASGRPAIEKTGERWAGSNMDACGSRSIGRTDEGRWPANVILSDDPEVQGAFPESNSAGHYREPDGDCVGRGGFGSTVFAGKDGANKDGRRRTAAYSGETGSAARFFYSSKADADDRLGSRHPTIKPVDLIQYLVRLVTPPKGLCLDPFAGTGTTGEACIREGMRAILIEREEEYQEDIRRRMRLAMCGPSERSFESQKARNKDKPVDHGPLFGSGEEDLSREIAE